MVTMAFHIGSAPHSPTLINSLSPQVHLRTFNPSSSSSSSSSPSLKVRCIQVKSESHFPLRSRRQPDVASQNLNNCSRKRGHLVAVRSQTKMEQKPVSDNRMLVFVPPHPLIKHWISVLRNELTPCPVFKNAMAELGRLLIYEASRDWLPTISGEIQSPLGVANVEFVDPREPVAVIPILRAGLALAEYASSILPATKTYHLGASRDEETLETTIYLNKLPEAFSEGSKAFVVDPMLATGNTMIAALNLLKERGLTNKQIKVISALACPPALQKLNDNFPGLHVYTGMIDPTLNDKGWIIPGLGDAGDRSFGTE